MENYQRNAIALLYQKGNNMNPVWKKKWLKALRSDKYDQGRCQLVNVRIDGSHSFCCLGVLCDILPAEIADWRVTKYSVSLTTKEKLKLPRKILQFVEITKEQQENLISYNDITQYNFKQIANWIEKNL